MKFDKMPAAQPRDNDHPKMIAAIEKLGDLGIDIRRPVNNRHQIKVTENINFWPVKGSIFVDEEASLRQQKGFGALLNLLIEHDYLDARQLNDTVEIQLNN